MVFKSWMVVTLLGVILTTTTTMMMMTEGVSVPEAGAKFDLRDVKTMMFRAGRPTLALHQAPDVEMRCVGGSSTCAVGLRPTWAKCVNVAWDGVDVRWECETDADRSAVVDTLVVCEPWEGEEDTVYSVAGSCSLQYILDSEWSPARLNLSQVDSLTFAPNSQTTTLFASRKPQAAYVGSDALVTPKLLPKEIECFNTGKNPDGSVRWRCQTSINPSLALGATLISCEPFPREAGGEDVPDDIVIDGSCSIHYDMVKETPDDEASLPYNWEPWTMEHNVFVDLPQSPDKPVEQLTCVDCPIGPDSPLFPTRATCACNEFRELGCQFDPEPKGYVATNMELTCAGFFGGSDPYKIPGSCTMNYALVEEGALPPKAGDTSDLPDTPQHMVMYDGLPEAVLQAQAQAQAQAEGGEESGGEGGEESGGEGGEFEPMTSPLVAGGVLIGLGILMFVYMSNTAMDSIDTPAPPRGQRPKRD